MAARKFKFVSPGIFLREVDNSQLPKLPGAIGPVIIGRTRKGPAMKPVTVNSYADFVEVFGEPVPGGQGDDVWREGNGLLAPAYAHYAAKAYFAADIDSPVTTIRLAGVEGDNATDTGAAGWTANSAWGLFVSQRPSNTAPFSASVLAAVLYGESPFTASLSNVPIGSSSAGSALVNTICSASSDNTFTINLKNNTATKDVEVSFDRTSKNYIRNVLNTNPVATNSNVANTNSSTIADKYWLGETFEEAVPSGNLIGFITRLRKDNTINYADFSHEAKEAQTGWVFSQDEGVATEYNPEKMEKLFRIKALNEGEVSSKELVISIEDIRISEEGDPDPYGSFSVVVKKIKAGKLEVVESFTGCTLNPNSSNYVARQVGDQFTAWSAREKRNKIYGNYPNRSRFIRMDMKPDVDNGLVSPSKVPFGFFGPLKPADYTHTIDAAKDTQSPMSGALTHADTVLDIRHEAKSARINSDFKVTYPSLPHVVSASTDGTDCFGAAIYKLDANKNLGTVLDPGYIDYIRRAPEGLTSAQDGGTKVANTQHAFIFSLDEVILGGDNLADVATANVTSSFFVSGSRRSAKATTTLVCHAIPADATTLILTDADGTTVTFEMDEAGNGVGAGNVAVNPSDTSSDLTGLTTQFEAKINASALKITADGTTTAGTLVLTQDIKGEVGNTQIRGTLSSTAFNPNLDLGNPANVRFEGGTGHTKFSYTQSGSATTLLQLGFDKFQMPLVGGFDGVDITEADPFNNRVLDGESAASNYAFASVDRAIELIKDPEIIEHNLALMPGITNTSLTTKLIEKCESRADSLAIIDLPGVYKPPHELNCTSFQQRLTTTPTQAATSLKQRQINSSYGAAYYPWVKIRDVEMSRDVWVPPSVIALGVMAYTEESEEVWFAPAGFNRGGLNEGNAGLPVIQVSEQLLSKQRDTLYNANINPIASFVTEGIVVFGQKTLQSTQSALDRINVRRLLIFVKKEISRIASGLLFDQNVPATWNRFLGQVNPFLQSVQTRLGLSDFKVILDNTTTTPDLVDRNVMYAKIFLKPARAIEFIAVDFVITNTGASFED